MNEHHGNDGPGGLGEAAERWYSVSKRSIASFRFPYPNIDNNHDYKYNHNKNCEDAVSPLSLFRHDHDPNSHITVSGAQILAMVTDTDTIAKPPPTSITMATTASAHRPSSSSSSSSPSVVMRLAQLFYPTHTFHEWLFKQVNRQYWDTLSNQKSFFDWARSQLEKKSGSAASPATTTATTTNDGDDDDGELSWWYNVTAQDLDEYGGRSLIETRYHGSLHAALSAVYPHHSWRPWKFRHVSSGVWKHLPHQRAVFDEMLPLLLNQSLSLTTTPISMDRWYEVTLSQIRNMSKSSSLSSPPSGRRGGRRVSQSTSQSSPTAQAVLSILSGHYNNSLSSALITIYPQHAWQPWRFTQVPLGYWNNMENQRAFFEWLRGELHIHSYEDWYHVSAAQVAAVKGGKHLISRLYAGSLPTALSRVYPDVKWDMWRFKRLPKRMWDNNPQHLTDYFHWLEEQLNITEKDQWYQHTVTELYRLGIGQPSVRCLVLIFTTAAR
jgi:hypothetical protein